MTYSAPSTRRVLAMTTYLTSSALNAVVGFLAMALLQRLGGVEVVGQFSLWLTGAILTALVLGAGSHVVVMQAVARDDSVLARDVVTSVATVGSVLSIVTALVGAALAAFSFGVPALLVLVVASGAALAPLSPWNALCRLWDRPGWVLAAAVAASAVAQACGLVAFVVVDSLVVYVVVATLIQAMTSIHIARSALGKVRREAFRQIQRQGLAQIPFAVQPALIQFGSRMTVAVSAGVGLTGVFSMAMQIATVPMIAMLALNAAQERDRLTGGEDWARASSQGNLIFLAGLLPYILISWPLAHFLSDGRHTTQVWITSIALVGIGLVRFQATNLALDFIVREDRRRMMWASLVPALILVTGFVLSPGSAIAWGCLIAIAMALSTWFVLLPPRASKRRALITQVVPAVFLALLPLVMVWSSVSDSVT